MITTVLFLGLVVFVGYLAKLPKPIKYALPKAFLFVWIECILATLFFALLWIGLVLTGLLPILSDGISSFFTLILCNAIIVGLLLYHLNQRLAKKHQLDNTVLTLAEYIIQWGLIYITIYQVIFDHFISKDSLSSISQLEVSTPTDLMVLILPALISVWIAVILDKLNQNNI